MTRRETLRDFMRRTGHVGDPSLTKYVKWIRIFTAWLAGRELSPQAIQAFSDYLLKSKSYSPNTVQVASVAVNYYLSWCGTDLKMRRPEKVPSRKVRPATLEDRRRILQNDDYTSEEKVAAEILADTGLRPSDIVGIRTDELDFSGPMVVVRRTAQKNLAPIAAYLSDETTVDLKTYLASRTPAPWLFPSPRGGHRSRSWLGHLVESLGDETLSPRSFRRFIATKVEDLQAAKLQGGWRSSATILDVYRSDDPEKHMTEVRKALNLDADPEIQGYG